MSDECQVNYATIAAIKGSNDLKDSLTLHCWSHALNNAGDAMLAVNEDLNEFLAYYNHLVSHSEHARALWRQTAHSACPRLTNLVRWYVRWEEIRDLLRHQARLLDFFRAFIDDRNGRAPSAASCRELLQGPRRHMIQFAMRVIVNRGRALCKACYFLEGDGFLLPFAANRLLECRESVSPTSPLSQDENVWIRSYCTETNVNYTLATEQTWRTHRDALLAPAFDFLNAVMPANEPAPAGARDEPGTVLKRKSRCRPVSSSRAVLTWCPDTRLGFSLALRVTCCPRKCANDVPISKLRSIAS
jgi:hypothetical protein